MGKMGDSGFYYCLYSRIALWQWHCVIFLGRRRRPLSTNGCGAWMRMLLEEVGFRTSDAKYLSRSLKCTFLSYLAKRGVSMKNRRILGYHTDGNKVPLTYSRDAAGRPFSILEPLISEIHKGEFLPHSTRRVSPCLGGSLAIFAGNLDLSSEKEQTEVTARVTIFLTASKITFLGPILLQFLNTHLPKLHIQNNYFDSPKSSCSHGPRMLRVWCKRRAPELQTRQSDFRFRGRNAVRTEESEPDASKTGSTMSPLPAL